MPKKRKKVQSNLKQLLIKHGLDQKTLHKIANVREHTIGEMTKDENKSFTRENLDKIINALDIKNIEELISIVEAEDDDIEHKKKKSTED